MSAIPDASAHDIVSWLPLTGRLVVGCRLGYNLYAHTGDAAHKELGDWFYKGERSNARRGSRVP